MKSSRRLLTATNRRVGANEFTFGRLVQNMLQPVTHECIAHGSWRTRQLATESQGKQNATCGLLEFEFLQRLALFNSAARERERCERAARDGRDGGRGVQRVAAVGRRDAARVASPTPCGHSAHAALEHHSAE